MNKIWISEEKEQIEYALVNMFLIFSDSAYRFNSVVNTSAEPIGQPISKAKEYMLINMINHKGNELSVETLYVDKADIMMDIINNIKNGEEPQCVAQTKLVQLYDNISNDEEIVQYLETLTIEELGEMPEREIDFTKYLELQNNKSLGDYLDEVITKELKCDKNELSEKFRLQETLEYNARINMNTNTESQQVMFQDHPKLPIIMPYQIGLHQKIVIKMKPHGI